MNWFLFYVLYYHYLLSPDLLKCVCYLVGIRGGMFRYRRKHSKKQDQSKSFVFNQLFVGATIFFDDFVFTVTDVDDKSLRIMINYPKQVKELIIK